MASWREFQWAQDAPCHCQHTQFLVWTTALTLMSWGSYGSLVPTLRASCSPSLIFCSLMTYLLCLLHMYSLQSFTPPPKSLNIVSFFIALLSNKCVLVCVCGGSIHMQRCVSHNLLEVGSLLPFMGYSDTTQALRLVWNAFTLGTILLAPCICI